MLLRRFTEHVKDQNWFAVALDFVIVVSGVFLAFQLSIWAEERQARANVENALARLHEESIEVVRFLDGQAASFEFLTSAQDRTVAALSSGNLADLDERTAQIGIISMVFFPATTPPRTVYDEMSATGMLTRIENAQTREAITDFYQALDYFQGQLEYFRQGTTAEGNNDSEGVVRFYDPDDDERAGIRVDLPVVAQDTDFIASLSVMLRNQLVMQRERRALRDAALAMCGALARDVGAHCPREDFAGRIAQQARAANDAAEEDED